MRVDETNMKYRVVNRITGMTKSSSDRAVRKLISQFGRVKRKREKHQTKKKRVQYEFDRTEECEGENSQ